MYRPLHVLLLKSQASQGLFHIGTAASQPYEVGLMTSGAASTYNYAPVNYMQTPYERLNYFGEGSFDVSDDIQFTASFRGNTRRSDQELAPLPYDSNIYPSYAGVYNGTPYLGVSEDNYYLQQAYVQYSSKHCFNSLGSEFN